MAVERAYYKVTVNGENISSTIAPILLDLSVNLTSGPSTDTATIELDDKGGRIKIPPDDALVEINLGWVGGDRPLVFRGKVNDCRCKIDRSGGRTMTIGCTGMDTKGKSRELKSKHYDRKTVSDILRDAGKAAGISDIRVDSDIGSIEIEYLAQLNESFVNLGNRLAKMFGGTFKIAADKAVMVKRNAGRSVSGAPLKSIAVAYGVNLIDADVKPYLGRPRAKKSLARWYDRTKAKWVVESTDTEDTGAKANGWARYQSGSEPEAKGRSSSEAGEADRNKGEGTVVIDGEPAAQPEAPCTITGVRSGVDGGYLIDAVTHSLSRSGGFTTSLTLKRPKAS